MVVNVQNFHRGLGLLFAIVKCADALLDLAEFRLGRVLLYVVSQLRWAAKLLVDFENQLLSVNFSITEVFVDFE